MNRWRPRVLRKVFGGFAVIVLLHTLLVGVPLLRFVARETEREIDASLVRCVHLLEEVARPALVDVSAAPALDTRLRATGRPLDFRQTVIAPDGRVLAESHERAEFMDNHARRPEILEARQRGIGRSTRFSTTIEEEMSYVALRVDSSLGVSGYVRCGITRRAIGERRREVSTTLVTGGVIAVAVALAVGFWATRQWTLPITRMTEAAERMAAGESVGSIVVDTRDELGDLSRALATMAQRLNERLHLLDAERNKLVAVLGSMVEGVIAVDSHEIVRFVNEAARRILGTPPTGWVGQNLLESCRIPKIVESLREAMVSDRAVSAEVAMPAEDGRERRIEVHATALNGGAGERAGALLVLHDISELRRLEGVRRDFVANVSHELKTPLAAMKGLVETLEDDAQMDPDTRRRFLEKTRNQIVRLTSIVADLLTLSRVESTRFDALELRIVDLRKAIDDSRDRIEPAAKVKSLALEVRLAGEPLTVLAEDRVLSEIFDNLLDNAVKYTPGGGRIEVRARRVGEHCVVEVADTGIGIEPRDVERVFERFYRVDKARSRDAGSTGLGLSIARHSAELLRGMIRVESTPGRGSTFIVWLPFESGEN